MANPILLFGGLGLVGIVGLIGLGVLGFLAFKYFNPMKLIKKFLGGINPFGCGECEEGQYCKINKCTAKNPPGASCLAGQDDQCIGNSKCILGGAGEAICSAGRDGINPPGVAGNPAGEHFMPLGKNGCSIAINCPPGYYCRDTQTPCKPEQNPGETCRAEAHSQCMGNSECRLGGAGEAICTAGRDGKNPPGEGGNPAGDHFMPLEKKGCSININCPPGYYCRDAQSPCKPEQNPGATCRAGAHSQCKGASKCILGGYGSAICSAGRDGVNPPGVAGNPANAHYLPLNKKGCSAAINCPPGYYCRDAFTPCKKAQAPGASCLAGQHGQCRGYSKCILGTKGAKCSAGRNGRNAPGEAGNPANQHYQALGTTGCSAASQCPPGYWCKAGGQPCAKGSPSTGERVVAAIDPTNW